MTKKFTLPNHTSVDIAYYELAYDVDIDTVDNSVIIKITKIEEDQGDTGYSH